VGLDGLGPAQRDKRGEELANVGSGDRPHVDLGGLGRPAGQGSRIRSASTAAQLAGWAGMAIGLEHRRVGLGLRITCAATRLSLKAADPKIPDTRVRRRGSG
jgi:hypothetical protein